MTDNPLGSLIQLVLLIFVIWSIVAAIFVLITNKHLANLNEENTELRTENAELRKKLTRYEQSEPEWVKQLGWRLFDNVPSDPTKSALN